MFLKPQPSLPDHEVERALRLVIIEGLTTETMNVFTQGAFLVAMALLLGASNFQIGVLAAMPTFTNIFQLVSIWLVRRYNNRRAISVWCSLAARVPLLIIGGLLVLYFHGNAINTVISSLFFYFLFGSIAGPSWNAWMKDLVPENRLGRFFSQRSRNGQILNVVLSLLLAFGIHYVKSNFPHAEHTAYGLMYLVGGIAGISGVVILSRTPEILSFPLRENVFRLLRQSLADSNFVRLLVFNASWVFALNIAVPFFTVFMMRAMGLSLPFVIGLTVTSQLCSIFTIRVWGKFSDYYSNKTIIAIGGPLYICCILAWCFVGIFSHFYANLSLLIIIHVFMGVATAGINLSLTNIGLKLAPKEHAIVYLSAKNIVTALFSFIAPLIGGRLADYFSTRHLNISASWKGPGREKIFHLLSLNEWNFLFLIGAFLAIASLQLLVRVKEIGEVEKDVVVKILRSNIKSSFKENFIVGNLISFHTQLRKIIRKSIS